jgi:hypothetical protein
MTLMTLRERYLGVKISCVTQINSIQFTEEYDLENVCHTWNSHVDF